MPAIGIDLGTTFSCVAVWQRGQVEIIPNAQGARTTPSYVSFKGNERLIGEAAKRRGDVCPKNTVFDAKRLIGRKFDDPQIQDDIKQWPFEIINKRGTPKIEVEFCDEKRQFYPEEISSMVLTEMKEIAEAFLGEPVKDAVITVPAYFNDSQRQATKDAGKIAGLNVHRIINEPTAAALAYGLDKNIQNEKKVLIFDFGGGTTDVSILNIKKGSSFEVLSTVGNLHLGGEDFDGKLVDFFCNEFEMEHGINIRTNAKALRKLRTAAENSKQELSSSTETSVVVDALADGIDFDIQLSRARFENICAKLFEEAFNPVRQALAQAHLDKMAIDDVVLVGGSTRMPKIKSMLKDFFCGKQLNCSINPDEAVAYGAAVQAFMLTEEGKTSSTLKNVRLLDVTPLSLGVRVKEQEFTGRTMAKVVPRNTMIPCNYTEVFTTVKDNQTCISVMVYEGEEQLVCKNNLLGQFHLSGIAPAPAGVPKIDMTFDIDVDGILHVTARDRESGRRNDIKITNDKGRLSETDINRMMEENELCRQNDINRNDKIGAKNKLQKYIYSMMENVQDNTSVQLSMNDKHKIKTICREAEVWIRDNPLADKQDYDNKLKQVENMCTWMFVKRPSHGSSCHQDHQDKKRRV